MITPSRSMIDPVVDVRKLERDYRIMRGCRARALPTFDRMETVSVRRRKAKQANREAIRVMRKVGRNGWIDE